MQVFPQNLFNVKVEVNGVMTDFTSHVPFPIKWSDLLDEQLDEAYLSIMNTQVENFPPFAKVTITRWNTADADDSGVVPDSKKVTTTYFVATDKADEKPVGSGFFNHDLYIIEETKWLERFIIPSTGFVNNLGRIYVTDD